MVLGKNDKKIIKQKAGKVNICNKKNNLKRPFQKMEKEKCINKVRIT
jgi:hypothetical protein